MQKLTSGQEAKQFVQAGDNIFRGQSSSHTGRPQTSVPGEINFSSGISFDYTNLLTKDNSIKETRRNLDWNSNLGRLANACVPAINSSNCSTCVQNFQTKQTYLPKSIPDNPLQTKSSNRKNVT